MRREPANIKCYADSFLHLKVVPIGTFLSRCRLHRRNTPGKPKLRKGKVRIRLAELQARVEKARFRQGSGKVRHPATTGFKSPRSGATALISIASWAAHHLLET